MKLLLLVLVIVVVLAVAGALLAIWVTSRRVYQGYSEKEELRTASKQKRNSSVNYLRDASATLTGLQHRLIEGGGTPQVDQIEVLQRRLATVTDRIRYGRYGYAPLGSREPVRENELAGLDVKDSQTLSEAKELALLTEELSKSEILDQSDLSRLADAVKRLEKQADQRERVRS